MSVCFAYSAENYAQCTVYVKAALNEQYHDYQNINFYLSATFNTPVCKSALTKMLFLMLKYKKYFYPSILIFTLCKS